jgi:carbon-monoxide dehydrogenase large subunit
MDPAELRAEELHQAGAVPLPVGARLGIRFRRLSHRHEEGDGRGRLQAELRKEQAKRIEAFKRGETREIMGVGVSFFTEIVGAGPVEELRHPRHRHVRLLRDPHPSDRIGIARMGTKSQGQGHETTWAQIIATEIGIPADDIMIEEGNTDTAPYGLGTYGSRSTPVAGAATRWRRARSRPRRR